MDFHIVWVYRHLILQGFLVTVEISAMTIVTSTIVGLIAGLLKTSKHKWLISPIIAYVEIFRGSPVLIQLFMVYFGLPYLGVSISMFNAVLLVFTLYSGAYIAEIVRAGIESISNGQREAAMTIGLTYSQMMRKIILPQALRVILPPLFGWYISLLKDTSIASVIGYTEMVFQGQNVINMTDRPFEVYLTVAALYFIISYPLSKFVDWMERRRAYA
ncbi:amino acid ABC transporter permease [Alicyclobacillaceae bacterium I2511]|nr:amino acid ABC transporter permease [Alicyclobacillaceae bacterium I2511]